MSAKGARNVIAALIILAIGIRLLLHLTTIFVPEDTTGIAANFLTGLTNIGDLLFLVLIVLALIMVPFYLSARSKEKKEKEARM